MSALDFGVLLWLVLTVRTTQWRDHAPEGDDTRTHARAFSLQAVSWGLVMVLRWLCA